MIRAVAETLASAATLSPLASWAIPRSAAASAGEAAFCAGAALNMLDNLVRSAPPWAGAWRQRLALKCAVAAVRRLALSADESKLRDAWHLKSPGADPGPAGRVLAAWRRLATRLPEIDEKGLAIVADLLGVPWRAELATILDKLSAPSPAAPPFAVAAVVAAVLALRPDAKLLAWWLGDLVLARSMRWPAAVPLLIAEIHAEAHRGGNGRARIAAGTEGFERAVCLAVAQGAVDACRIAADMARREAKLAAVAPKLRAKGAGEAVQLLRDDDAVSGSLTTPKLSRWAARRLFERLTELDAVRELTGRPTFRLYGL